jgi:chaperonin GroEL
MNGNKIVDIRYTGRVTKMQCIKVSNPDNLYITDNYIVTHNTTSAIVLAEAIFKAGYRHVKQGANGIQLYNDIKRLKDIIISQLDNLKKEVTEKDVFDVAKISANGDSEIAKLVADAILSVGENGHVSLETCNSRQTVLEKVEGAMYKEGWRKFGPHGSLLITDKSRDLCELSNPAVLLYAGKLESIHDISDFIFRIMGKDETTGELKTIVPILFVAHEYSDDVKNFIIQNKLPIAAIRSPSDGTPNARTRILEDLAVLLGGQVSARGILDLKDVTDEHLGCANLVEIGPEETVFYGGNGEESEVLARINELNKLLETVIYDYDKEELRIRIGKLSGGVAVIKVGGDSELEIVEKRDRIEDALCASRVAIADGIIPGGGYALWLIAKGLKDISTAEKIMKEALQAPIKQIIENAGENAEVILSHLPPSKGYDADKKEYVNLMEVGIVDPVKVTKAAIENAVSIVGLLLTTGGSVVNDADSKDGMPNPLAGLLG